ncbi:MAG TPA: hypothetical protein VFD62_12835 [Pyrinomonadaceae bacterium]|nr:hypothetical protein [Pyrinomonadaceae bacterium]
MTNESFEPVELGKAEAAIEFVEVNTPEEAEDKFTPGVAPYVEFDE